MLRILGVVLIVAGALGIAYRYTGITYTEREKVIDLGPIHGEVERQKTIPIPPYASGGALAVGIVLVLVGGGRKKR